MKKILHLALAIAMMVVPPAAIASSPQVIGPSTFTFTGASQSNIWTCNGGQSTFALTVASGLTGTFTVTVGQTSGAATNNPPFSYAPGSPTYTNTITNSGSLTINLGSNGYVKVADTSYSSGTATASGVCSSAVAVFPAPTPLPSAPALSGANFTNLPLNQFSGLTSGNCVVASASTTLATGSGACAYSNVSNTFTNTQTFNSLTYIQANAVGGSLDHALELSNTATSKPDSADAVSNIIASSAVNTGCTLPTSQLWPGIAGASSGNYGGYWVFWTKTDATCSGNEVLVLTAGNHIYPAGPNIGGGSTSGCIGHDNQWLCGVTTPSTCSAGVPCGTVTVDFGVPYYQTDGATQEQPYCFFSIQDTNLSTNAWQAVTESIAYNAVTVGYAPLVAQSTARSLYIYGTCNASSY